MEQSRTYISGANPEYINIAQISHEIRNPLTLINCTLQLLDYRYPQLKTDDLWMQLQDDVNYLKKLTLTLSDYKNCDNIYVNQTNMELLLKNVANTYQPLAQSQNKHLILTFGNELPCVQCDEIKIRQALINLLKNAFEATKSGDTVEIQAKSTAKRILISAKDNGKGIAPDKINHIFKPFVTDKEQGTGMGLAITRKIITQHKGSIQVYSRENIGTKFIISLPVTQIQTQHPQK